MLQVTIKNLEINHSSLCFADFNASIHAGDRIAIVGRNGCGKSSLLRLLAKHETDAALEFAHDLVIGYVPQIITNREMDALSGGQKFNKMLGSQLALNPDILCLDEPTNHLDVDNRRSLLNMLLRYSNTLCIATHDLELINKCCNVIWHIENFHINVFNGSYHDYCKHQQSMNHAIDKQLNSISKEEKALKAKVQKQQQNVARKQAYGKVKYADDKMAGNYMAGKSQNTDGRNRKNNDAIKNQLLEQKTKLFVHEVVRPKFVFDNKKAHGIVIDVANGAVGYVTGNMLLSNINFSMRFGVRVALVGKNASGKSTFLKALMKDFMKTSYDIIVDDSIHFSPELHGCIGSQEDASHFHVQSSFELVREGEWNVCQDVGYLDQHYRNLDGRKSVLEHVSEYFTNHADARKYLNDFMFRKDEQVSFMAANLSGGQKALLSLALIGLKAPRLLILDEITNNLDLELRSHVVEVLNNYSGALLVVSHDQLFLKEIEIEEFVDVACYTVS